MTLSYHIKESVRWLSRDIWATLLTLAAFATPVFLFTLGWQANEKLEAKLLQLETQFTLSVVLADDLSPGAEEELARQLERLPAVASVTYHSKAEALAALEKDLETAIGAELAANPLPASFRLRLKPAVLASASDGLADLAAILRSYSGVREVLYPETWAEQFGRLLAVARLSRWLFWVLFGVVTGVLVVTAVRQLFCNRQTEITTLRLLGAPWSFTLAPYLVAGGVIGLGGGLFGLLAARGLAAGFSGVAGTVPLSLYPTGYAAVGAALILGSLLIGTGPLTFHRRHRR